MKLKATIGAASVFASLAVIAAPANADGQLRGGMTSVKVVASTLATQTQYTDFKWTDGRAVSAASEPRNTRGDNFKWGKRNFEPEILTVSNESPDANEARSRWGIRADADQARSRWGIRADADQARSRWGIRADADQARSRWGIRADADQARSRWGIRADAGQARSRRGIR
ncbi:MAG: hypothetical protein V2I45_11330 [Halieaceae bacterium]|nr:hypothetical protein [Halieaceae bacterium]